MKVSRLVRLHGMLVFTLHPDFTLAETARRFAQPTGGRKFSVAVVSDADDKVLGVVSLGDISYALAVHEDKAASMRVQDIMTKDVLTCSLDDDIEDVLKTMAANSIRHMPVVENGRLAGLLSRRDALEFLYQQAALDVESLSEWVFHSEARY